jgi:pSer/pThr/pTyr-binding forkhead associated (FHA) protein
MAVAAVDGTWTFGRSADCTVQVSDEYASPHHCRAYRDQFGQIWVVDLGSTNGTRIRRGRLGGQEVKVIGPTLLEPGDALVVGRTVLPWSIG